jgi:spore germination cell wall hydrolase CwlJ-like protein
MMFFQMAAQRDPMRELRTHLRRLEEASRTPPTEADQRRAAQLLLGRGEARPRLPLTRMLSQQDAEKMVSHAAPPNGDNVRDQSEPYTGEEYELGRLIYSESLGDPEGFAAVGSVVINRLGLPGYGATLRDVIHQDDQFEVVREGNPRRRDSVHWTRFDQPERLTTQERKLRDLALETARGLLTGKIGDPTGGATHFHARNATSPWFERATRPGGSLVPLPSAPRPNSHVFYREIAPAERR